MSPLPKGGCQSERIDRGILFTQSIENTAFVHISMNNESSRHAVARHPPLGKEGFRFCVFIIIISEINSNFSHNYAHYTIKETAPFVIETQV